MLNNRYQIDVDLVLQCEGGYKRSRADFLVNPAQVVTAHGFDWTESKIAKQGTILALSNGDTIRIAITLEVWNHLVHLAAQ